MPERPLSDRSIYRARPTVRVDGSAHELVTQLLVSMRMTEHEAGLSELELRFSNWRSRTDGSAGLAFEDERILKLGASISVYGGDERTPQEIFRGKISAIEAEFSQSAPPELVVLAEDALQQSRMLRRTKLHRDVSIAAVAREIASRAHLRPVITDFDTNIGTQLQLNESDLAFLRRLLRAYDGDLQVVGEELQVAARSRVQRETVNLALFSQLTRARVTADLAEQTNAVTASGWDPEQAQRIAYTSHGSSLGPGSGRTGADVLGQGFEARSEHIGHVPVLTDADARAMADAAYDQRARRFVLLEGRSDGNPALRVGTHAAVRGLSPRFDNVYYVVRVCHHFNLTEGYLTDFEAECAYLEVA